MALLSLSRRKDSKLAWILKASAQLLLLLVALVHPIQSAVLVTRTTCNGFEYMSSSNASTFETAVAVCKAHGLGWSLAAISSAGQQSCLYAVGAGKVLWLGLNTVDSTSRWLNDDMLLLNNFASGSRPANHCTVANTTITEPRPNWLPAACSSRHEFLCQKSSTPTGATPADRNVWDLSNRYTVALVSTISALVVLAIVLGYCLCRSRAGVASELSVAYTKSPINTCDPRRESQSPLQKKMSLQKKGSLQLKGSLQMKVSLQKKVSVPWTKEPTPEAATPVVDMQVDSDSREEAEYVMGDWEDAPFYRHQSQTSNTVPQHSPAHLSQSCDSKYKQSVANTYDNLAPIAGQDVFAESAATQTQSVLSFVKVTDTASTTLDMSNSDPSAPGKAAASGELPVPHPVATPVCSDESSAVCRSSRAMSQLSTGSADPDSMSENTMLEQEDCSSVGFSTIAQRHVRTGRGKSDEAEDVIDAEAFRIARSIDEGAPTACNTDSDLNIARVSKDSSTAMIATHAATIVSVVPCSPSASTANSSHVSAPVPNDSTRLLDEATLALDSLNEQLDIFCHTASLDSVSQTSSHQSEAGTLATQSQADRDVENAFAVLDELDNTLDDLLD